MICATLKTRGGARWRKVAQNHLRNLRHHHPLPFRGRGGSAKVAGTDSEVAQHAQF